ncbi:phosphotransferase [Glycomyces sp. MUSA5-2]|uniref:phosphotransferase n=1 Tax=Glycomyces sp. MUSA5-2 TaxID=2053002 RepID=UPI00300A205B
MQPPRSVLEAFGALGEPRLLHGGQGRTWASGKLVFKPADNEIESTWRAETLIALPESEAFRVPRPVRSDSGSWTVDGWEASELLAGSTDPKRWSEAVQIGEKFHAAIADLPRPEFLSSRDDWWSRADRDSWNLDIALPAEVDDLAAARAPIEVPHQLVHGDLLGNILYEPGLPPAVIDWPPYWRPTAWATAVALIDAVCWHRAPTTLLDTTPPQLALRALLYRTLTDHHAAEARHTPWTPHPAYSPAIKAVLDRVQQH